MVGIYRRKDVEYNVRASLHKQIIDESGSACHYDINPSRYFKCKDLGFKTQYISDNGHIESIKSGSIQTRDLMDGEIKPEDYVCYANEMYRVVEVLFEDDEKAKFLSKRPSGTTTISVKK